MDYTDKEYCLEVWGPLACFTRPELKVERVSYDVPHRQQGRFLNPFCLKNTPCGGR